MGSIVIKPNEIYPWEVMRCMPCVLTKALIIYIWSIQCNTVGANIAPENGVDNSLSLKTGSFSYLFGLFVGNPYSVICHHARAHSLRASKRQWKGHARLCITRWLLHLLNAQWLGPDFVFSCTYLVPSPTLLLYWVLCHTNPSSLSPHLLSDFSYKLKLKIHFLHNDFHM